MKIAKNIQYQEIIRYQDELYHHGVKGQKWGVKNGPPYPLDDSNQSLSEKKAERGKFLDKPITKQHNKSRVSAKQQKKMIKKSAD